MLEFLVDNIFVVFAGKVFQQTVGIPMGTNCAPLLADIFLYSYEADFIQSLLSTGKKHLASRFNLTYRYIDDVLSINNPEFENYLGQMYPAELEIKDTTESTTSASYLDLLLSIGRDGQLHTSIYDKRDDFNFHITNFPFLSSNIPSSPAYGVFISQLIRYSRACSSYECFILRARRLSSKLLKQGYLAERLKSSFRKFYGRYGDLIWQYEVSLSRMLNDILILDQQWLPNQSDFPPISWPWYRAWPSPIMSGFHGAFATGVACQQGTLTLPDTWFRPPFWDLLVLQLLRPNSSNLPCLYSTFHIEYPLVLSRFCLSRLFVDRGDFGCASDYGLFHAFLRQQNIFNNNNDISHIYMYTHFRSNHKLTYVFSTPINHRKNMSFISLSNSSRDIYEPTVVLNTAALCIKNGYFIAKT